ncbi:hypothetical protein E1B28_013180 [Marasmius oreades]|uniref:NAD(P)-binding protein n=1 Tax=Marasmius oreades TaxID=181124 RepID=A0A9P7UPM1_9AGAR|nr:uncharacterized protein E1B28_013180 [Marasmius oreades]KAG7087199.1 hypothetical protein E1B28_013180 [Marasmius oreades]
MSRIILVTGANTGIGYDTVRVLASKPEKHTVYLASRNEKSGKDAQAKLQSEHNLHNVKFVQLDITDIESVQKAKAIIEKDEGGLLDVLVHNAGVGNLDQNQVASTVDLSVIRSAMETNLYGTIQTTQTFLPLLRAAAAAGNRPKPVILLNTTDMSSNTVQARPDAFLHVTAYNTSKAAANSYMIALSHELRGEGILVNCITPGFTSTKLNNYGQGGGSTSEAGELLAKWSLLEGELKGKTGLFWSYKGEFAW